MPEIPRLNGVINALEEGKTAAALAGSSYDGVAFEAVLEQGRKLAGRA
jgi:hypothetical protein